MLRRRRGWERMRWLDSIINSVDMLLLLLLLSHFSHVRLCATPQMAAHQAPPSIGFSRQEYWSGLPLSSTNGYESEQTQGDSEGQGSLVCCSPWVTKSQTQRSDWTTILVIREMQIKPTLHLLGFSDSAVDKESACNVGDPSSIPGSGRSTGEGIGYALQYSWASLVAQLVKNPSAMQETWVRSLGWEDPLENVPTPLFWLGEFHGL